MTAVAFSRKLPDGETLKTLRESGWSYQRIADHYGCSRQAVSLALKRIGLPRKRPDRRTYIPWTVSIEHNDAWETRTLRLMDKEIKGEELTDAQRRQIRKLKEALISHRRVIVYDTAQGFGHARATADEIAENRLIRP